MSRFIVVEGLEGAGKTTAIKIAERFIHQRFGKQQEVIITREPGGTPIAESLRAIMKQSHTEKFHPMAELLLIYAARTQLLQNVIYPALKRGAWVIGDRHCLSTWAYQGGGRQLGVDYIKQLQQQVMPDFFPDLTLYLDVDPQIGLSRAKKRGQLDRIEQENWDFFQRARQVYLMASEENPKQVIKIDANQPLAKVHEDIQNVLEQVLCIPG